MTMTGPELIYCLSEDERKQLAAEIIPILKSSTVEEIKLVQLIAMKEQSQKSRDV
ncbi:hypothetical protein [Ureibacillus sinduriensis]|uniref:hypothetical protein n=1 Tax=Ureibacillus sinduriensis TaxID=561440 RepID=UPI000AE9D878|nr:hypothetical protein [Ureibacillus sinduriensis]